MDRELWTIVMAAVRQSAKAIREPGRKPTWPLWLIAAMELWRTWHRRSLSWACDPVVIGMGSGFFLKFDESTAGLTPPLCTGFVSWT